MWWMSSCITVVLDELAELCALLDVLGLVVGELEIAQLPLCFACGVGGAREELPQQRKECATSIMIVSIFVISLEIW